MEESIAYKKTAYSSYKIQSVWLDKSTVYSFLFNYNVSVNIVIEMSNAVFDDLPRAAPVTSILFPSKLIGKDILTTTSSLYYVD